MIMRGGEEAELAELGQVGQVRGSGACGVYDRTRSLRVKLLSHQCSLAAGAPRDVERSEAKIHSSRYHGLHPWTQTAL